MPAVVLAIRCNISGVKNLVWRDGVSRTESIWLILNVLKIKPGENSSTPLAAAE
jgi:hypothetical protein